MSGKDYMEALGRIAFTAYREYTCGLTHDDKPMPEWDDLGPRIQGAWQVAARAAMRAALRPGGN